MKTSITITNDIGRWRARPRLALRSGVAPNERSLPADVVRDGRLVGSPVQILTPETVERWRGLPAGMALEVTVVWQPTKARGHSSAHSRDVNPLWERHGLRRTAQARYRCGGRFIA